MADEVPSTREHACAILSRSSQTNHRTSQQADALLIVPCYNEAQRLDPGAYRRFVETTRNVRLVMVDDGSDDGTAAILAQLESSCPGKIIAHYLHRNCGKAEAVRQGMQRAFALHPAYVGYWDADLATPLELSSGFREVLHCRGEIDVVLGSRIPLLGRNIRRSRVRWVLGRGFANIASAQLGMRVYDTQCGAKLFRVSDDLHAAFRVPFVTNWIFDVEILLRLSLLRGPGRSLAASMYEYPLDSWREVAGSKLRPRHFLLAIAELVRLRTLFSGRRAARLAAALLQSPMDERQRTAAA